MTSGSGLPQPPTLTTCSGQAVLPPHEDVLLCPLGSLILATSCVTKNHSSNKNNLPFIGFLLYTMLCYNTSVNIIVHTRFCTYESVCETKTYTCNFLIKVEFIYTFFHFLFENKLRKVVRTVQGIFFPDP